MKLSIPSLVFNNEVTEVEFLTAISNCRYDVIYFENGEIYHYKFGECHKFGDIGSRFENRYFLFKESLY